MKKLIYRKFILDFLQFFISSLFVMGLIVWTLQAVNYFDFVTEDGHGLKTYFFYTILNFPKIIHRIIPFIFFISLFYIIIEYKNRDEIIIFWINGISKVKFTNQLILVSIIIMIIQIIIGVLISPSAQYQARLYLKNSNIDFFTSLIKEGKFINITKGLTIFIDSKNLDETYSNIFIEEIKPNSSKMIYANKGLIKNNNKIFQLFSGSVINNDNAKINIFNFDQIDFDLDGQISTTILVPKIQEISTIALLSCFVDIEAKKFEAFECEENLIEEIKQELTKRIYKPFYIPLITLICSFLIINFSFKINNRKINYFIFLFAFLILLLSEASLRYSSELNIFAHIYLIIPLILFSILYVIFLRAEKNV
jgi:lipopolysaccharide export system permease protein